MKDIIFRIDDIGTSAKHFEQHGQKWLKIFGKKVFYFPFANFWFLKRIWPFKRWAKYDELTAEEWEVFFKIFQENNIVPIIAITACWVDEHSNLIPFPEKFPEEAIFLKKAFAEGKIVIANHSLAHCIVGKHMPKFWGSNRSEWREFIPSLPAEVHRNNIVKSQEILENFFEKPITIFVPPGNVWSIKTYNALAGTNLKTVMSSRPPADGKVPSGDIVFKQNDEKVSAFHDRELKLYGAKWLLEKINYFKNI